MVDHGITGRRDEGEFAVYSKEVRLLESRAGQKNANGVDSKDNGEYAKAHDRRLIYSHAIGAPPEWRAHRLPIHVTIAISTPFVR